MLESLLPCCFTAALQAYMLESLLPYCCFNASKLFKMRGGCFTAALLLLYCCFTVSCAERSYQNSFVCA
jgi:hypothetical protein